MKPTTINEIKKILFTAIIIEIFVITCILVGEMIILAIRQTSEINFLHQQAIADCLNKTGCYV